MGADEGTALSPEGAGPTGRADDIDRHVAARIRLRRTLLGLSQENLANALGMTFQQVQKYESGANRVSASRLYSISKILRVPISYFFDELPEDGAASMTIDEHAQRTRADSSVTRRKTLELVRAFYRIDDDKVRERLFDLMKSLAADSALGTLDG